MIDTNGKIKYEASQQELAEIEEKQSEIEEMETSEAGDKLKKFSIWGDDQNEKTCKEFIVLFHRGEQMQDQIVHARRALIIFLQSLPLGSRFNVCSYSSHCLFMFENVKSVPNTDENILKAVELASKFDASNDATDIFTPLKQIFE